MSNDKPIYDMTIEERVVGRLTKDPEVREKTAWFSMAINQRYRTAQGDYDNAPAVFREVKVFGEEFVAFVRNNLHKGAVVDLYGVNQYSEYTNRDGEVKGVAHTVLSERNTKCYIRLAEPVTRPGKVKGTYDPAKAPTKQKYVPRKADDDSEVPF